MIYWFCLFGQYLKNDSPVNIGLKSNEPSTTSFTLVIIINNFDAQMLMMERLMSRFYCKKEREQEGARGEHRGDGDNGQKELVMAKYNA